MTLTSTNFWLLLSPAQASGDWWSRSFRSPPPDPPQPRGGRPGSGEFCAIAPPETLPNTELPLVASNPPTLVWQGDVRAIELWGVDQTQPLWNWNTEETTSIESPRPVQLGAEAVYQLTANIELQPDHQYEWRVYQPLSRDAIIIRFAVAPAQQQAEIQQNLPLTASDAAAQGIHRADYFASQQLWSDFWREVLSIEQPSDELNQALNQTISNLCP